MKNVGQDMCHITFRNHVLFHALHQAHSFCPHLSYIITFLYQFGWLTFAGRPFSMSKIHLQHLAELGGLLQTRVAVHFGYCRTNLDIFIQYKTFLM